MCIGLSCVLTYQKNEVILYKLFSHGVNFNYLSVNSLPVIWSLFRICKIFGTPVSGVRSGWHGPGLVRVCHMYVRTVDKYGFLV